MALPKAKVVLDNQTYTFYLVDGFTSYMALAKYGGNATKMVTALVQGDLESFNKIRDELLNPKELLELFNTFVGGPDKQLKCGDAPVDIKEHFAGKPSLMYKLLFEAIKANDESFFASLPTLIEKAVGAITEKLQANSLQNPSEIQKDKNQEIMDNLTKMAEMANGKLL